MFIKLLSFFFVDNVLASYQKKTKGEIGLDNCRSVSGGVDFGLVGGNFGLVGRPGCSYSGCERVGETSVEEW